MSGSDTKSYFRPDIEGLRAVAIGAVLLFHAGVPGADGGFIGVDVFFVISGFLITGLLVREWSSAAATSTCWSSTRGAFAACCRQRCWPSSVTTSAAVAGALRAALPERGR